ncbi:MAG TPA: cyclodeaminase/cyclohydrolase family protein [Candidatus Binatus sp.]|nr:cyclodeaminase/cyclohydrolase family protein [Candidatus Binatus sp.]
MTLSARSIDAYTQALASADPTPGGGSASALVAALAAALASMVARLTAASPKYAAVATRMNEIAREADGLVGDLVKAIDADVAAFEEVTSAYRMPKDSDERKAARSEAIQHALVSATNAPMHVVDRCALIARLSNELVDTGNPNAISDAGCSALFAQTAARGAALNIRINVKGLKDADRATEYQKRLDTMLAEIGILVEVAVSKADRATERT